jgi:hypothetical protein
MKFLHASIKYIGSDALTAVATNNAIAWDVALRYLAINRNQQSVDPIGL